jgi:transcriptional regulator with XRE-family HTH domain
MNLQRLRKSRGLSVKDLQEFFGFEAPQAIYKWQSGASLPSVDNLLALSQILEVPMERILVKNELPTPQEPDGSVFLFFWDRRTAHCLPVPLSEPKNKRVPAFTAAFSPAH